MIMEGLRLVLWVIFFVIHNILGFFSYLAWYALIIIVKPFHPKLFWKLEGFMYQQINRINAFWLWGGGFTMHESGDDVAPLSDSCCLLVGNHQNTCDVPSLLAWLATKPGVGSRVFWVMDVMFKFSHFGIISHFHRDFFIQSGRAARDRSLEKFRSHLIEFYRAPLDRKWILVYPEGGFLYKQMKKNHEYAQKNGLPIFHRVGLPRIGAVKEVMNTVGRKIEYVIDLTMAYDEEKNLNFYRMFVPRRGFDVAVHTRVFAASDIPQDDEGQLKWMIDRWREKEQRMEYFAEHKTFPVLPEDEQCRLPGIAPIRKARQVQFMTAPRFCTTMLFTLMPGGIAVCVLACMLWTVVMKLQSIFV